MVDPELALPNVDTEQQLANCLPSHPLDGEVLKHTQNWDFQKVPLETEQQLMNCLPCHPRGGEV